MGINVVKNVKEKEEELIKEGSIVRASDDEKLFMVIASADYSGVDDEYMILDLKTGLFYGGRPSIEALVKSYDLVLATNDVDIICNNVK